MKKSLESEIIAHQTVIRTEDYTLYQGVRASDLAHVFIKKAHAGDNSSLLQYEYDIMQGISLPQVPEVLGIEEHGGGKALVLRNGRTVESLRERLRRGALSIEEFLPIAIELAEAVGQVHRKNLIHKALMPDNILLPKGENAPSVYLLHFAHASRLASEREEIKSMNALASDLRYIAPEQTGRMNRLVDWRSDLYSLGCIFYEMLVGKAPFEEGKEYSDKLAMMYAHIAVEPIAPYIANPQIPTVLSDVVTKLLKKNAEERYQSGGGLKAELEECQRLWKAEGNLIGFVAGSMDRSDRFRVPQKLYGREKEVEILLASFSEAAAGLPQMLLVSGRSGIGKSALVNEVQKPMVEKRGYVIQGKFDQFKRNIPYSALTQAFSGLIRQLLGESDEQLQAWKTKILDAVGGNGQVIIDVLPEIEKIIGVQPVVPPLGAQEAQNRFNLTMESFVRCFAQPSHPLVLFLDDLQWSDAATLNLLKVLMGGAGTASLLVIAAYRDNEVNATHPFIQTVGAVEEAGGKIVRIAVNPLEIPHVRQLISEIMSSKEDDIADLAELVYQKTEGNPFFVGEFLGALYRDQCIWFENARLQWQWSIDKVRAARVADNVVDLMIGRLQLLSKETQEMVQLAACVGNRFELEILAVIAEQSQATVAKILWQAVEDGLLQPLGEGYKFLSTADENAKLLNISYQFLHDRVQQAAYGMIKKEKQQAVHLKIGRLLMTKLSAEEQEERLFDIVNQVNEGISLLTTGKEKIQIATVNLKVAKKAKESAAYSATMTHTEIASELLPENAWHDEYALTMDVYKELAGAYLLNSELSKMKDTIDLAIQNARTTIERTALKEMQMMGYMAQGKIQEAFAIGIEALQSHGINVDTEPLSYPALVEILQQTEAMLTQNRLEADEKTSTSEESQIVMRLAMAMITVIFVGAPQIFPQFVCLLVQYSITNGHTAISPYFLVWYTLLQLNILGDFGGAEKNRLFTLHLHDRLHDKALTGKMGVMDLMLLGWVRERLLPLAEQMKPMFRSTVEIGDYEFAAYFLNAVSHFLYYAGTPLPKVTEVLQEYYRISQTEMKHIAAERSAVIYLQLTRNLSTSGLLTPDFSTDTQSEAEFVVEMRNAGHYTWLHWFYVMKAEALYLFDLNEETLQSLNDAIPYAGAGAGFIQNAIANFYSSLASLSLLRKADIEAEEQAKLLVTVEQNQGQMLRWTESAPFTFQHKYELIEAERRAVQKDYAGAKEWFEKSIATAQQNAFLHDEALANRRAGAASLEAGNDEQAKEFLSRSHLLYGQWGATALQELLERQYPQVLASLIAERNQVKVVKTTGANEELDLMAVMKASQIISGEIDLKILLEKLLKVVMESSGAQKAALVLRQNEKLIVQAELDASGEAVVLQNIPLDSHHALPQTLLQRVGREREITVLENAAGESEYSNDAYIRVKTIKSALALPVVNQGKLIGVLYAENNLVAGAFTSERVQMLTMLSSQMAISIENALLIENMTKMERLKREMEMAAGVQMQMLPKTLPEIPGYEVGVYLAMAKEAGGDFYDVLPLGGAKYLLVIGDVSGKGMPAALFMSAMLTTIRTQVEFAEMEGTGEEISAARILSIANAMARQSMTRRSFVTIFAAILDAENHTLSYSSAGHDPAIQWNATSGRYEILNTKGSACNFAEKNDFARRIEEKQVSIEKGEMILWNTDGITEAKNEKSEEYTDKRYWGEIALLEPSLGVQEGLDKIVARIATFSGSAPQYDDMTLLGIKRLA